MTVSEHQVRLGCFPLASIGRGNQELAALSAMQSRGGDFLILETVTPAFCSGCSPGTKSCWADPLLPLQAQPRAQCRDTPKKPTQTPPHWLTWNSGFSAGSIFCGSQCEMNISLTFPWACHPKSWWKATPEGSQSPPQGVLCAWVGVG